jgi:hypothetical protein
MILYNKINICLYKMLYASTIKFNQKVRWNTNKGSQIPTIIMPTKKLKHPTFYKAIYSFYNKRWLTKIVFII